MTISDCRFKREDDTDFGGYDILSLPGDATTLIHDVFSMCHLHSCVAIVCALGGN